MIFPVLTILRSRHYKIRIWPTKVILASSSPYRQQLLQKLQIDFIAKNPEIDESPYKNELAINQVKRLAKQKALALNA
jgi:predicted house-cleaning NTP pyrophosphatase (Maf/HAM1 superfamily)